MNKFLVWLASVSVATLGLGLIYATTAQGWSPSLQQTEGTYSLNSDQTHQGSLYVAGERVVIDGRVTGSLYCAGGTEVIIRGAIENDVLCAAPNVTIENATIGGDMRLAGVSVNVSAAVSSSVSVAAQDLRIGDAATISRDLNGLAANVDIDGQVSGDVAMAAQSVVLSGTVGGAVDLSAGDITLSDTAKVAGDFNYASTQEQSLDESLVSGSVNYQGSGESSVGGDELMGGLVMMLGIGLASALLVAALAPRFVNRSARVLADQPVNTVLYGFAVVFGLPIVSFLLLISVFLLPIGIVGILVWIIAVLLSGIFVAYYIGAVLLRGKSHVLLRMVGGVLVLGVLMLIPLLNVLVVFTTIVVGSGMLVATLLNGYRKPAYAVVDSTEILAEIDSKK